MKERKRWAMALLGLVLVLAVAACGGGDGGGAGGDEATITFMQPLPKSLAFYPYLVGEEFGYFDDEGVNVDLRTGDGGTAVALQIAAGRVDLGSAPAPDVLAGLSEGEDWKVVYNYYQGNVFSIVVPEESDIRSVPDLDGKNLGITSQAGGEVGLVQAALNQANLKEDEDVRITVVGEGGPQVARALENGDIDAFAGAIQDIPALQAAGIELRDITPERFAVLPSAPLFMQAQRFEDEQMRDVVTRFLRAWAKSTYAGIVNQDVVFAIGEETVPEETGNERFARAFLDLAVKLQTPPGDRFGESTPESWTTIEEILVAGDVIPEVIPPDEFVDKSILDDVNDWDRADVEEDVEEWASENDVQ